MSVLNIMYANEVWKYFTDVHGFENNQIGYTYAIFPPHYNYSVICNATKTKHMDWILNSLSFGQHTKSIQSYFKNAEYNEQNFDMTLSEFKVIFWWEWAHRQLGRLIGLLVLLPMIYFTIKNGLWILKEYLIIFLFKFIDILDHD